MISPAFLPFIVHDMLHMSHAATHHGRIHDCSVLMTYLAMCMHNEPELTIEMEDMLRHQDKVAYDLWINYKANFEKVNSDHNKRLGISSDKLMSLITAIGNHKHGP